MNSLDVLRPCFVCRTDAEAIYVTRQLLRLFFFWLCWVFVAALELSLVAASGGYSSLRCSGSRRVGFSSCGAGGLTALQRVQSGSNWCPLHCKTDS